MSDGNWQTMESALKGGTEVYGYREDAGAFVMVYGYPTDFMDDREIDQIVRDCPDCDWLEEPDWFAFTVDGLCRLEGSERPTHWQPLPGPPES